MLRADGYGTTREMISALIFVDRFHDPMEERTSDKETREQATPFHQRHFSRKAHLEQNNYGRAAAENKPKTRDKFRTLAQLAL